MGWEERGGRSYYYRKVRDGDTVRSEYVGSGELARCIADLEAIDRERRQEQRRQDRREWQALRRLRELVDEARDAVRTLKGAALVAAGYHTHRGQWRKSRRLQRFLNEHMADIDLSVDGRPRSVTVPDEVDLDGVADLFRRVNKEKPNAKDVKAFRAILNEHPALWKIAGDMVELAKGELLASAAASVATQESMRKGMDELARSMGYETAPTLERLLIDEVVMTWLHLRKIQYSFHKVTAGQHRYKEGRYWESRLSAAQRRHLRAVESLARVRKMQPLQINIARQQVNVSG